MERSGSQRDEYGHPASRYPAAPEEGWQVAHGATASGPAAPSGMSPADRLERRRHLIAGLVGAVGATILSLIFIASFIGALHDPRPRSAPVGVVGPPATASTLRHNLDHAVPGGFVVTRYSTETAARSAIADRKIDAALVAGPHGENLLVAEAVGASLTNDIIKVFTTGAARAHVPLAVTDIRPLHPSDPEGLSQTFFVTALLAPSFTFGNLLIRRIAPDLGPHWHMLLIAVYAPIVAAVAVAIADAAIGALTGAPWGLFGIGTLFAFAVAVIAAAAARWAGGIGVAVFGLLFIPIGLASSGVTLGPNMITPWYADVGKALPPGNLLPAVLNTTYFNGNAIAVRLGILSAWALAGILAMVMALILHPPIPGRQTQSEPADAAAASQPAARHRATA